jgi:hypothetical protein
MASASKASEASETLYRAGSFANEFPNSVVIALTETMLSKSIIDASAPIRDCLQLGDIHDYALQPLGPEGKVQVEGEFVLIEGGKAEVRVVTVSMYRPSTKKGDPRIWVGGLQKHARPGDQVAIGVGGGKRLVVTNLSSARNLDEWKKVEGAFAKLAPSNDLDQNLPLERLVAKLEAIARSGPVPADGTGDTAVGRTMETALGIEMNSSKEPDWEGTIELKFGRPRPTQRRTLFAQVPDWSRSALKSSEEILDAFGYQRDGSFRLYVEVGASPNSRGLYLAADGAQGAIFERSTKAGQEEVATWPLGRLQDALARKHRQTCWIVCEESVRAGVTHFLPTEVLYTHSPRVDLIPLLVAAGDMTLDHLIKRTPMGGVREKGPLWKVSKPAAPQLLTVADSFRLLR